MDKCLDKSSAKTFIKRLTLLFFFLLSCNLSTNQASVARCLDYETYFKQISTVLEKEWSKENIFKNEKDHYKPLVRLGFTVKKNKGLLLDSVNTFFSDNIEAEKLAKKALISSEKEFPSLSTDAPEKVNLMANLWGNGKVTLAFSAVKYIDYKAVMDRIAREIVLVWNNEETEIGTTKDPYFIMVFKVCSSGEVVDGSFSLEYPDAAFRVANFKGIEQSAEEALLKAKERFFPLPIGSPEIVKVKIKVAVRKIRDMSTSKKY